MTYEYAGHQYTTRTNYHPGDRIRVVNKQLYLNGKAVQEPYKYHKTDYIDPYRDNFPSTPNAPLDPGAVERAYRFHRARRAAKEKRHRERRWAGLRFWVVLAFVVAVTAVLAVRTLGEIERVFGL